MVTASLTTSAAPTSLKLDRIKTPLGKLLLVTCERERVRALDFEDYETRLSRLLRIHYGTRGAALSSGAAPARVRDAIEAYFSGTLSALSSLRVETAGTPFQREVWAALRKIPIGTTTSYGALAAKIGRPAAVRAVGLANGANPIGIIVPCHRVVGSNASLTGYAGGIDRKRWLLKHEGVAFDNDRVAS